MNRSSVVLVLAAFASLHAGCNAPSCGPGTKQVQMKGGTLQCVPVDALPDTIPCDVDAGATIIGGQCVSHITCGPNTTLDPTTGECTGTGMGTGLPVCPTPAAGTLCIHGLLHNLVDNSTYMGPDVKVSYYDPLAFLAGAGPMTTITSSMGGYVLSNVAATTTHIIAITTGDFNDTSVLAVGATGDQNVVAGNTYRVDAYVVPRSLTDGWKTQTGTDYLSKGAYVAIFFGDKNPTVTNLADDETMPISGVQLTDDESGTQMPVPTAQYFSTGIDTIDPTLKMTSAVGGVIYAPPAMATPQFSGKGGMVNGATPTWVTVLGGTAPSVVFVSRFHPM